MYYSSTARWNALIIIVLAVILIGAIVYSAESFNNSGPYVPSEFTSTRADAAQISTQIVDQASSSTANLNSISAAYNSGKYQEALSLVTQEVDENNSNRTSTAALSNDLGVMANDLYQVRPDSAQQVGVQAISEELQVVSNVVSYDDLTTELLNDLKAGYLSLVTPSSTAEFNSKLNSVVSQLNSDAQNVNSLNKQYQASMSQFDSLTK